MKAADHPLQHIVPITRLPAGFPFSTKALRHLAADSGCNGMAEAGVFIRLQHGGVKGRIFVDLEAFARWFKAHAEPYTVRPYSRRRDK